MLPSISSFSFQIYSLPFCFFFCPSVPQQKLEANRFCPLSLFVVFLCNFWQCLDLFFFSASLCFFIYVCLFVCLFCFKHQLKTVRSQTRQAFQQFFNVHSHLVIPCHVVWSHMVMCGTMWCGVMYISVAQCGVVSCTSVLCGIMWCLVWCFVAPAVWC